MNKRLTIQDKEELFKEMKSLATCEQLKDLYYRVLPPL